MEEGLSPFHLQVLSFGDLSLSSVTRDRKDPKVQVPNMSLVFRDNSTVSLHHTFHMTCHKELPCYMNQDLTSDCRSPPYLRGGASTHLPPRQNHPDGARRHSGPSHERYLGRPSSEYYAGHKRVWPPRTLLLWLWRTLGGWVSDYFWEAFEVTLKSGPWGRIRARPSMLVLRSSSILGAGQSSLTGIGSLLRGAGGTEETTGARLLLEVPEVRAAASRQMHVGSA